MNRPSARRGGRAFLALSAALLVAPVSKPSTDLGDFADLAAWRAAPSEGVQLTLSSAEAAGRPALRMDFDFQGKAGWAAARRELSVDFSDNWEIDFDIRGEGSANDLEIKLIDTSGDNVWWSVRRDFRPPAGWETVRLKKRQFSFAWGPAGGGEIRHAAALEMAMTAREGGRGWIAVRNLRLTALPPPPAAFRAPIATASSSVAGFAPIRAIDGEASTAWRASPGPSWIALDFGDRREFGGLTVKWEPGHAATRYVVETSDDGTAWKRLRSVEVGSGLRDDLMLPEAQALRVRLRIAGARAGGSVGIAEIVVRPLAFGESVNAFFETIAREAPRGTWPRAFSGEQSYWTVAGVSGDDDNALVSEDGAVEPFAGAFSVEPFLYTKGRLFTWADGVTGHALEDGDLPLPRVIRTSGDLSVEELAVASGLPGRAVLTVRYRILNRSPSAGRARLFLAVRPIQVNPPSQFLNRPGGARAIRRIEWNGRAVEIDGTPVVFPLSIPSGFGAAGFDAGPIVSFLARGSVPPLARVDDPFGYASGALAFDVALPPGGQDEVAIELPIHPKTAEASAPPAPRPRPRLEAGRIVEERLAESVRAWRERVDRIGFEGPPAAEELFRTARANLANILLERDGPALRPGTRAYARSWIRDGAMMAAALLRLGHPQEAADYAEWFVRFQSPDGRVPCCVDRRGADPVVENDSHGELIFLIAENWRYTKDRAWLQNLFPHVEGAVSWIDRERLRRRTPEVAATGDRIFFGLLPESISHEGYSAKPVHSYWDDFWALKGLRDAVPMAAAVGRADLVARWTRIRDEFAQDLYDSIARVRRARGIDYIPASAELADFDPTSTTIALDPGEELARLPADAVARTFDRYDAEFEKRRTAPEWDYTPYEIRNIGAFVRLGRRERVPSLLDFFLKSRRPPEWRAWAEGVASDPRKVKFVGDIPHAWVGSDFIRALTDLFVWPRDSDASLVLASGIPASWLDGGSRVAIRDLRTPFGSLSFSLERGQAGAVRLRIDDGLSIPPGGLVLRPPLPEGDCAATVGGAAEPCRDGEVTIRRLPADVVFRSVEPRGRARSD